MRPMPPATVMVFGLWKPNAATAIVSARELSSSAWK